MINLGFHEHLITEKIRYALKQGLTKQRLMEISTEVSILSYKIIIECLDCDPVPQTRIVVKNGAILEDSILDEIIYEVDRIIVEWG